MRLHTTSSEAETNELSRFSYWLTTIGDGEYGDLNNGETTIEIPDDVLLKYTGDPITSIIQYVYFSNIDLIEKPEFLRGRAILTPTLEMVEAINQHIISNLPSEGRLYLSSDKMCNSMSDNSLFEDVHTPEFLNSLKCSGLPNHQLYLKIGTPVMLLRNTDPANGLCNGTIMVITKLTDHVLEVEVIIGMNAGDKVLISRISLTASNTKFPFKFQRRQFPIIVCYAMTINKSQGQSLECVGLFLQKPVFTHGQLYVAMSRVTNRKGLKIIICGNDGRPSKSTRNVVDKEVYRNL